MIAAGMSQRQAAKALGVAEGTVRNDLRNNSAKSAQKLRKKSSTNGEAFAAAAEKATRDAEAKLGTGRMQTLMLPFLPVPAAENSAVDAGEPLARDFCAPRHAHQAQPRFNPFPTRRVRKAGKKRPETGH